MNVPIIGQPKVVDFSLSLVVACTCGKSVMLLQGKVGAMVACGCGAVYVIGGFASKPDTATEIDVSLGVGRVPK